MSAILASDRPEIFDKDLVPGFRAENELEWAVACDPDVQRGWAFPVDGAGHPERLVGAHVAAVLRNIGHDDMRSALRFVTLVHDSMKWAVRRDLPWSPDNDHAALARRVAERYTRATAGCCGRSSCTTRRTGSSPPGGTKRGQSMR
jgi:hypothetical protein